jgi:hypothetical protein
MPAPTSPTRNFQGIPGLPRALASASVGGACDVSVAPGHSEYEKPVPEYFRRPYASA